MSKHEAQIWERSIDQNGRPCWVNKKTGQACYVLLDKMGLPLPHFQCGSFPAANPAPPMAPMAPMGMTPMGAMPMCMPPAVAPVCPPAAATPIAIVGGVVKPDKWEKHKDKNGNEFFHNPSKPDETTWEMPKEYEKQQNAGKPSPPSTPKKKGRKYR